MKNRSNDFPVIFDDLFNESFWSDNFYPSKFVRMPAVNITERNNEFQIDFAVPGMKKEDFQITLAGNMLSVSCEKEEEKEDFKRREFAYNKFNRNFDLPDSVVKDGIKAKYENGMLKLLIPKNEEAKAKIEKEIKIS